jgi:hypothetical protein
VASLTAATESGAAPVSAGRILLLDRSGSNYVGRPDPIRHATQCLGPFGVNRTLSRRHARFQGRQPILHPRGSRFEQRTFINGEHIRTGTAVPLKARIRCTSVRSGRLIPVSWRDLTVRGKILSWSMYGGRR